MSNKLTDSERERLALLAEECAEVIQVVAKVLRHGYDSHHPSDPNKVTNKELLIMELGHVFYAMSLMTAHEELSEEGMLRCGLNKARTIAKWLHHQDPEDLKKVADVLAKSLEVGDVQ